MSSISWIKLTLMYFSVNSENKKAREKRCFQSRKRSYFLSSPLLLLGNPQPCIQSNIYLFIGKEKKEPEATRENAQCNFWFAPLLKGRPEVHPRRDCAKYIKTSI